MLTLTAPDRGAANSPLSPAHHVGSRLLPIDLSAGLQIAYDDLAVGVARPQDIRGFEGGLARSPVRPHGAVDG